jgi:hypothetical protein
MEHVSIYLKAQEMMKGTMEPSAVPTMVRAMLIVVHVVR